MLRRHCDDVGRDPGEIEVTALIGVAEDADRDTILREVEALAAVGSAGHRGAVDGARAVEVARGDLGAARPGPRRRRLSHADRPLRGRADRLLAEGLVQSDRDQLLDERLWQRLIIGELEGAGRGLVPGQARPSVRGRPNHCEAGSSRGA